MTAPLQHAVALDPEFALGHAVLACSATTSTCRSTRWRTCAPPCDLGGPGQRPRTQLRRRRVGPGPRRSRAPGRLLHHLDEHPRDALALNMAVPTIAFSGAVEVPGAGVGAGRGRTSGVRLGLVVRRPAGLRPAGAGPLRRGRRARQGCVGRRARGRARRARAGPRLLRDGPAQRRAALDRRLDRRQPAPRRSSPSHYSWHAALHELALGDETAVRRR